MDKPVIDVAMDGVRGGDDGCPRLMTDRETGRLWVTAYNEGGRCCAGVDLGDLLQWLDSHPDYLEMARRT